MCYVSMATAMGLNFDMPIVLHSLTMSLFSENGMKLPIPFDLGFIIMLKLGTNDNQIDKVVESYAHNWWNDHMRTKCPPYSAMFTTGTVDICLAYHWKQPSTTDLSMPPQYLEIISPLRISMPTAASADQQHSSPRACPGTNHPIATEPCSKCYLYCALAASLYEDLVGIKNFISTMSVVANNDVEVMSWILLAPWEDDIEGDDFSTTACQGSLWWVPNEVEWAHHHASS